ncbi:MAG: efflux RND transporter permease subunit [Planctomycetaceae bacterium]|nr:efflux RND transporter permease subunit [Planctomycetaceae bacterium]
MEFQLPATHEHVLKREGGQSRFEKPVGELSKPFAPAVPADATTAIEDDVAILQAIRSVLTKSGGDRQRDRSQVNHFENLQSASRRLLLITPVVLLLIFLLLHTTFQSARLALLIFLAVPMAASGGVFALAIRGMPFSIAAGVGFIALFGVAVLNGLVWVSAAEHHRATGDSLRDVAYLTAMSRLRPVLMTALVASLGFLPMALSTSDGAELQRPLASVVIGGLITSTLLTSLVVPAIFPWFTERSPITKSA